MNLLTLWITSFLIAGAVTWTNWNDAALKAYRLSNSMCVGLQISVTHTREHNKWWGLTDHEVILQSLAEAMIYQAQAQMTNLGPCRTNIEVQLIFNGNPQRMTFDELRAMLAPKVKAEEP